MKYVRFIIWIFIGLIVGYINFSQKEFEIIYFSFLVIYLFILFKWIGRKLDDRKIRTKMYKERSRDSEEDFSEVESEEVEPNKPLVFVQFRAGSIPDQAIQSRKNAIKEVVRIFDYSSLLSIIAASGYLLVHYFLDSNDFDSAFITGYYLIFSTILSHIVYRTGDLNAHVGNLRNLGKAIIRIVPQIAFVSPAYRFWTLMILLPFCLIEAVQDLTYVGFYGIGLLVVLIMHIFLLVRFHVITRKKENHKLLILRVFGINESAKFTFDMLQRFWKHFGSLFTVVDPTFMKNKYKDNNNNLVIHISLILIALFYAWFMTEQYKVDLMKYGRQITIATLFISLLVGIAYLRIRLYKIDRNFLRNRQDLSNRLQKLYKWPRKLDQSFKQLPLMCYENTWFIAVTQFIRQSDIILMDLRGLSEEKTGCETEIKYLLDTVPLKSILFLANQSDISLVEKVINKNWEKLNNKSPNLKSKIPKIRLFISSEESFEDVQGLMDLMLCISSNSEEIETGKV